MIQSFKILGGGKATYQYLLRIFEVLRLNIGKRWLARFADARTLLNKHITIFVDLYDNIVYVKQVHIKKKLVESFSLMQKP